MIPAGSQRYESEKIRIAEILANFRISVFIMIGSTAVPGLASKPTIDIMLYLQFDKIETIDSYNSAVRRIGIYSPR